MRTRSLCRVSMRLRLPFTPSSFLPGSAHVDVATFHGMIQTVQRVFRRASQGARRFCGASPVVSLLLHHRLISDAPPTQCSRKVGNLLMSPIIANLLRARQFYLDRLAEELAVSICRGRD